MVVSNCEKSLSKDTAPLFCQKRDATCQIQKILTSFFSGHCKKLAPEYAKAAQKLAAQDPPRYIAKVDATENKEVADKHGVKGFPTLVWYS